MYAILLLCFWLLSFLCHPYSIFLSSASFFALDRCCAVFRFCTCEILERKLPFFFLRRVRDTIPVKIYFLSAASSSRHEAMVGGALARASALRVGMGVSGSTIVSGSCDHPSNSWISPLLTSCLSLGISSLFCRGTQCM
jgi:hypothetical protein